MMMRTIYFKAVVVEVWLGTATPDSELGMEVLAHLSSKEDPTLPPPWENDAPPLVLAGLSDIMNRPYFLRLWIVQEIAVSASVVLICGNRTVMWPSEPSRIYRFLRNLKVAEISPQWEQCGLKAINMGYLTQLLTLQLRQHSVSIDPDILDIAHDQRHRRATDRRDMIIGLLGLAADSDREKVQIDYSKTVDEFFREFGNVVLRRSPPERLSGR